MSRRAEKTDAYTETQPGKARQYARILGVTQADSLGVAFEFMDACLEDESPQHPHATLLSFAGLCSSLGKKSIASRGAHDPQEQAREKARELEDLRRREDEAVDRLANEALQVQQVFTIDSLVGGVFAWTLEVTYVATCLFL